MLARSAQMRQEKMESPVMMSLPSERRRNFRTDLEEQNIAVEHFVTKAKKGKVIGTIVNLSTDGMRFKTTFAELAVGDRLSLRVKLPTACGIAAFISREEGGKSTSNWAGDFEVARVNRRMDGSYDIAGRLMNMTDADKGMLGLYLSLQSMAS